MAIELSNIVFTDQDDIVPLSGVEQILNTGVANTLAGNDSITGIGGNIGIENVGTLNTDEGNDPITGTGTNYGIVTRYGSILDTGKGNDVITGTSTLYNSSGFSNMGTSNTGDDNDIITGNGGYYGFENMGILNTDDGNDTITGTSGYYGIYTHQRSIFDTGEGNDVIAGTGTSFGIYIYDGSTFDSGKGNDVITGTGGSGFVNYGKVKTGDGEDSIISQGNFGNIHYDYFGRNDGVFLGNGNDSIIVTNTDPVDSPDPSFYNTSIIETGEGNDIITIPGFIGNGGFIDMGNDDDSIISQRLSNHGSGLFLGEGNDSITLNAADPTSFALENSRPLETGDGNDIITSTGTIYNRDIINTGNGDDSIIVDNPGTRYGYGIYNIGTINTGDGNDSIIANEGFESHLSGLKMLGIVFLRDGEDYIKGFGNGDFYGGNGNDTLELTPGSYTVGIEDTSVTFTKNGVGLMITSDFENLIAGSAIYDFTSLTAGQIIVVA